MRPKGADSMEVNEMDNDNLIEFEAKVNEDHTLTTEAFLENGVVIRICLFSPDWEDSLFDFDLDEAKRLRDQLTASIDKVSAAIIARDFQPDPRIENMEPLDY